MSNKLTREVKYLNESDRPKKVEPLSFSDWHRHKDGLISRSIKAISDWQDGVLNEAVREYATYLQEFSAEEVGVEFTRVWRPDMGECSDVCYQAKDHIRVIYLGRDERDGDKFAAYFTEKEIVIYSGKLNSGLY